MPGRAVARRLTHKDVLEVLTALFCAHGVPVHIRADNGSEFTAKRVRTWLDQLAIKPLFIQPGSPWANGYIESFNEKMRDELSARKIFYSVKEAQVPLEMWCRHYTTPSDRIVHSIIGPQLRLLSSASLPLFRGLDYHNLWYKDRGHVRVLAIHWG